MSGSNVGGTQNALTSVAGCGSPSRRSPIRLPRREMVLARPPPGAKAPCAFCSQASKGWLHSSFEVHATAGSANARLSSASRQ